MRCEGIAPAWGDPRRIDWEPISDEGDVMCPNCLTGIERHAIDGDAMELAGEALGASLRERPPALGLSDW